jgi:hypothetical protein
MATAGAFAPVNLIEGPMTPSDQAALKMVYTLYREVQATMDTERSRQQTIGISEYGSDCRKCVARKLSGLYIKNADPSWKAQVGTFIHGGLEDHFVEKFVATQHPDAVPTDDHPLFFSERRVEVMRYKSLVLGGSCDLYVQGASFGLVDDWKTQGPKKLLETGRGKVTRAYRVQMHTYGFGYELLGFKPTHVVLYALPRDGELWQAKPVFDRYNRQLVLDELADLQRMIDAAEIVGWETLIAATPRAGWCMDCDRFERQDEDKFFAFLQQ